MVDQCIDWNGFRRDNNEEAWNRLDFMQQARSSPALCRIWLSLDRGRCARFRSLPLATVDDELRAAQPGYKGPDPRGEHAQANPGQSEKLEMHGCPDEPHQEAGRLDSGTRARASVVWLACGALIKSVTLAPVNCLFAVPQKNQVRPTIPLKVFTPRYGSWIPAQGKCRYPTSPVSARLSGANQWVPMFVCRLNSKVPLWSGVPIPEAFTPAPKSANGTQRVPVAKL